MLPTVARSVARLALGRRSGSTLPPRPGGGTGEREGACETATTAGPAPVPVPVPVETDELCIPLSGTWSVRSLLSPSSPSSAGAAAIRLPRAQLAHLHTLAALVPPPEGSAAHERLARELGEMVRLVEAVRGVDVGALRAQEGEGGVPDGRVWQRGRGMRFARYELEQEGEGAGAGAGEEEGTEGTALLRHAQRTAGQFYVVEHGRKR